MDYGYVNELLAGVVAGFQNIKGRSQWNFDRLYNVKVSDDHRPLISVPIVPL